MDAPSKRALLQLARETLAAYFNRTPLPVPDLEQFPAVNRPSGVFVTVYVNEALQGCLGHIEPEKPLYRQVQELVVSAATRDPRFQGVQRDDLPRTTIEISVLSEFQEIKTIDDIVPGQHGVLVELGGQRGILLPQVAVKRDWSVERFLAESCIKAHLPRDAYLAEETSIYIFTVEMMSETEFSNHD